MATMTYDWLTAALLEPMLRRNGHGLGDLAIALYGVSMSNSHDEVAMKDGRRAHVTEFTTDRSRVDMPFAELSMSGWDPFAPPGERRPIRGVPAMWGAIAHVGDSYVFKPAGIRLHDNLIALPSSGGGMMLFRALIPETIATVSAGESFSRIVEHPAIDHIDLRVRRIRPADQAEIDALNAGIRTPIGSAPTEAGAVSIATFRNDKTPRRFMIPI